MYLQLRSQSQRRTVSSRRRSCLLVCRLEATLRPTPSHLLLAYLLLVRLLVARLHPVRLDSARLLSALLHSVRPLSVPLPSRHPLVEVDRIPYPTHRSADVQTVCLLLKTDNKTRRYAQESLGTEPSHQRYSSALTVRQAFSAAILHIALTFEGLLEHGKKALALQGARAHDEKLTLNKLRSSTIGMDS